MPARKINCFTCRNFYITWDEHFPYGCKAMGFKTRNMPSDDVLRASGEQCMGHEHKETLRRG